MWLTARSNDAVTGWHADEIEMVAIHLLEKDVCVVCTLQALFSSKLGEHLVFKGGTSLSKA
ncbi:hypothetical protein AM571_PC02029 (plasmid) [Rhizobium etli 8C-3]|uniref:Uncharacterized protein n=1 Tax=Rhizobium etli 8C-3 TaxID=538025 RepID=A0A1L5PHR7_RHIET|nr:hypothetical protein AM571_PC02029 [Rhizobium etli 8C-3]